MKVFLKIRRMEDREYFGFYLYDNRNKLRVGLMVRLWESFILIKKILV